MAEIHSNEQLVGQQCCFRTRRPDYQTQRHQEGRQLLNEPSKLYIHWKAISAASVSAVWDVFEEQSHESAGCHENHEVS